MKKLLTLTILSLLAGCYNVPDKLKPMPWIFDMMPKEAPNNYKRGWKDGCESGLANMTNSVYRKFYTFRQNQSLRQDATYYKTWKDTYTFCRHYAYGTLRQANMRTRLPNNQTLFQAQFMGAEGILDKGMLQLWGPGEWLLPFQKIGNIGGDPYVGTGQSEREAIGGVSASTLDYSGDTMIGNDDGGWTLNYGNIPFFAPTDRLGK